MKYSILIPTYKAKYLKQCIDSILNQTFGDFEIIIVNDASPENIDEIVHAYSDNRIKYYVNEKNCGAIDVVDNWNICLSHAEGDFVICMGDDDELAPDCLEQYNIVIDKYPTLNIYHGRVKVIDENSNFHSLHEARPDFESVYSLIWHRMNGRKQYIGDFLYKRSTLISNGGFYKLPLAWGSDDISAYIAAKDGGIANIQKPIFYYRTNSLSISRGGNSDIKMAAIDKATEWYRDFINNSNPTEELDGYYVTMIDKRLSRYSKRKKIYLIASSSKSHHILNIRYWLKSKKLGKLSFSEIVFAFITSIKMRKNNC